MQELVNSVVKESSIDQHMNPEILSTVSVSRHKHTSERQDGTSITEDEVQNEGTKKKTSCKRAMTLEILPTLMKEIKDVSEWRELGFNLKVLPVELENIESDSSLKDMKSRKRAMLMWWLNNEKNPTWGTVIQALEESGHRNLANSLHKKYCSNNK